MKRFTVALTGLAICALFASNAFAQANLGLRGIGLKAGIVDPEDVDATLGLGFIMDLGTFHPNFAFETNVGWWSQGEEAYGTSFDVTDVSFGGRTKYMFTTSNPSLSPFLGAGLGLHVLSAHAETAPVYFGGTLVFPGYEAEETEVRLGLDLGGGLKIDNGGQFAFTGEGWFSVVSDASHLSFMVGAIYMFGR